MDRENFTMRAAEWDAINGFVSDVGWSFVFGLNILLRSPWPVGSWYHDNAVSLMEYTHTRGYQVDWELGNEPDMLYKVEPKIPITPSELAGDFKQLKTLVPKYSPQTKRIIGPDVATLNRNDFFEKFLDSIGAGVLDAITWHHYYGDGKKTSLPDFYDVTLLDKFINQSLTVVSLVENSLHSSEVWVGETASTYDGGTPNVSDSYASGFMWLDKLGVAAISGQRKLCRQVFFGGGTNGLLNATIYPNPDYWLSVLHKRLVGSKVLYVTDSLTNGRSLRVYAHCTREDSSVYARGSVVLIVLNVGSGIGELILQDPELSKSKRDKYWLTPDGDDLTSKEVRLNGVKLELKDGSELPPLLPVGESASETVSIPARSFGFHVFKDASASACS